MSFYGRVHEVTRMHLRAAAQRQKFNRASWPSRDDAQWDVPNAPRVWRQALVDEEFLMSMLAKVFAGVHRAAGDVAADDVDFSKRCPILAELLTATPMSGGKRRQVATMTLLAEDGVWKAGLRDRDMNVSLWVSADTVQGVFDAMESALGAPSVPWRKTPDITTRNRK